MPASRQLTKLVAVTSSISAGTVLTLEGQTKTSADGLDIVPELFQLVAELLCLTNPPTDDCRAEIGRHLRILVLRYGTMRRAVEAFATRRRRHRLISADKAAALSQVMAVSPSLVEPTLKHHPLLHTAITKWAHDRGAYLDRGLDAFLAWLDAPVSETDAHWIGEVAPIQAQPVARPPHPTPGEEPAPPTNESNEVRALRESVLDDKHVLETCGPRNLRPEYRETIERLRTAPDPLSRAVAAIAAGDFPKADEDLSRLFGRIRSGEYHTLRGDRFMAESRFDDAVAAYREARSTRHDAQAAINLAVALMRAHRGSHEDHYREAIDLLSGARSNEAEGSPQWVRATGLLGAARVYSPAGDRDANIRHAVECFELALSHIDRESDPDRWAELHLQLGVAWQGLPSGKRLENIQRAITCFNRAAEVWTREADPDRWATVQNHLGHAWERLPSGVRAVNIQRAIEYFNFALSVRDPAQHAESWATLQNNLGNAYVQLPTGDARENIQRAIECHTVALQVWSRVNRRAEWAATQNNLGNAWALMPGDEAERERNLRRAISCYKSALEVRTRTASPAEWAATQSNLGSALLLLSPGPRDRNVREAIECFERALEVRSKDVYPLDWAKTQASLGHAWAKLAEGDRRHNLKRAIAYYETAVEHFRAEAHPHRHETVAGRLREARDELVQIGG